MIVKSKEIRIEYDEKTTNEIFLAEADEQGDYSTPVYPAARIHCVDSNIIFERVDVIHFNNPGDMSIDGFGNNCSIFSETEEGFEIEGHESGTEGYYNAVYVRRASSED